MMMLYTNEVYANDYNPQQPTMPSPNDAPATPPMDAPAAPPTERPIETPDDLETPPEPTEVPDQPDPEIREGPEENLPGDEV